MTAKENKMKNLTHLFAGLIFSAVTLSSWPANAFLPFIGPGTPTHDAVTDASNAAHNAVTKLTSLNTGFILTAQENLKTLKAKYDEYKNDYTAVINPKQKSPLEGSRMFASSKLADPANPVEVQRAVYDLFLSYPSSDERTIRKCEAQTNQFYIDTVIEINTAVKQLEEEYNTNLKEKVNNISYDILSGENGAESSDDDNGSWKNEYNVYRTFDDLMQILEELTALKAQYVAARAMKNGLHTVVPEDSGTQPQASLLSSDNKLRLASASYENNQQMAFAALSADESETSEEKTSSTGYQYRYNPSSNPYVSFSDAPQSDIASPFAESRDILEDLDKLTPVYDIATEALNVHNLIQSLPSKRELFVKYQQYVKLHDKSVELLRQSDNCVLQYLGRYYNEPEKIWYGNVFIGDQINDYDLREGLSGWAIESYEVAKAAKIDEDPDTEKFSELQIDKDVDGTDLNAVESQQESVKEQAEYTTGYVTSSQSEKEEKNNRELELLAWNIGAEAAEELAADQYSSSPQWGTPKKRFPIWNDQKNFYNQYIIGKYENIKDYLNRVNLQPSVIALAIELNKIMEAAPGIKLLVNKRLESLAGQYGEEPVVNLDSGYSAASGEKNNAVETLRNNKEKALEKLNRELAEYKNRLDEEQIKLDENNGRLNRINHPEMQNEGDAEETATAEEIQNEINNNRSSIEKIKQNISQVESKIAAIENAFIKKEQNIEQQYQDEIVKIDEEQKSWLPFSLELGDSHLQGITDILLRNKIKSYYSGLMEKSNGIINDARDYALEAVENAKNDILNIGDNIYVPSGNEQVVSRHTQLIDELKKLPFAQMKDIKSSMQIISGNYTKAAEIVTTIFQSALTENACRENNCTQPDSDYFIGASAQGRDFTAPKAAPEIYPAPLREVVHLDLTDFENIPKLTDGSVAKESMLDYGPRIPEIWKYILRSPAYVEKDINLGQMLSLGGEGENFMRGGYMPCRSGKYVIDARGDKPGYVLSVSDENYSECLNLKAAAGRFGMSFVENGEVKENNLAQAKITSQVAEYAPSELGTFLQYDRNKLTFRDIDNKAFTRLKEIQENDSDEEYKEDVPDNLYKKAVFDENQIGNFLKFMEIESELRQNVDEMAAKIQEAREDLRTQLIEAGFTPAQDFDLADETQYNEIRDSLDSLKNSKVSSGLEQISAVNNPTDSFIDARLEKLQNIFTALTKDKNELISLSTSTAADSTLDEQIKSEEVNQEVAGKYQEEADKTLENQLNGFDTPYCAVY